MSNDLPGFSERPVPDFSHLSEAERNAALIAEAEADFAAGRCVPHEEVAAWLDTWGKGERVPPPASWFK
jgi:predicted transcriptional regulator